jgi:hypothetical protein
MGTKSTVDETGLPPDLAEAFRRAADLDEPPETLEAGFSAVSDRLTLAGITVTLEDMYQPEPTRHAVDVGDSVEHVPCVMDAMIVANLLDEDDVEIRSESPANGETIHFHASEDEVTVTPKHAVVSFGLGLEESADPDLDSFKDTFNDPDAPIPTTCSVINAFPDSAAYEEWAAGVTDAAVMELDIETVFDLSKQAVRSHVSE